MSPRLYPIFEMPPLEVNDRDVQLPQQPPTDRPVAMRVVGTRTLGKPPTPTVGFFLTLGLWMLVALWVVSTACRLTSDQGCQFIHRACTLFHMFYCGFFVGSLLLCIAFHLGWHDNAAFAVANLNRLVTHDHEE